MAKRQSAKPENAKGCNPDRPNGKARKKNPRTQGMDESGRKGYFGYTHLRIAERAGKRNQSVTEHLTYLGIHARTKSIRHNDAKRKATV